LLFLGHHQQVEEVGLYLGQDEFLRASPSLDPAVIHTQKVSNVSLLSARTLHLDVFHDPLPYHHLSIDSSTKKEVLQPKESEKISVVDHPTEKKANALNSQKQILSAKTEKNSLLSEKIAEEVGEFKYYFINADKTPLVISPMNADITLDSFKNWVELHRGGLKSLLSNHGAVLLRDFPVKNAQDFAQKLQNRFTPLPKPPPTSKFPYITNSLTQILLLLTFPSTVKMRQKKGRVKPSWVVQKISHGPLKRPLKCGIFLKITPLRILHVIHPTAIFLQISIKRIKRGKMCLKQEIEQK